MTKNKKYLVPLELRKQFRKYGHILQLRDLYVKATFGFKNAIKTTKVAGELIEEFWHGVYELYPELIGKEIKYNTIIHEILLIEEKE